MQTITRPFGHPSAPIPAHSAVTGLAHRASITILALLFALLGTPRAFSQAQITSPPNGASLAYPSFQLAWQNVGQVETFIYLGSTQGNNDYYGASLGTAKSVSFTWSGTRPPTVWIRLWSRINVYSGVANSTLAYSYWTFSDRNYRLDQQVVAPSYVWKLPFPGGYTYMCTARAGDPGDTGHQGANFYSLDFARGGSRIWQPADVPINALHSGRVVEVFKGPLDFSRYTYSSGTPSVPLYGFPPNGYFVRLDADGDGNANTGLVTVYCHMKYPPNLNVGDTVTAGQQIGVMGTTGASTGEHLHITFRFNGSSTDPTPELDKIRIENLPIKSFQTWTIYTSTR